MIDDETLDRQLREAVPYINDDGFTARVIASCRQHGGSRNGCVQ
jgi:hypothetical protein